MLPSNFINAMVILIEIAKQNIMKVQAFPQIYIIYAYILKNYISNMLVFWSHENFSQKVGIIRLNCQIHLPLVSFMYDTLFSHYFCYWLFAHTYCNNISWVTFQDSSIMNLFIFIYIKVDCFSQGKKKEKKPRVIGLYEKLHNFQQ